MWFISALVIAHVLGSANALPESWGVAGCWFDDPSARTLSAASFVDEAFNTAEACASFCDERHFKYAGVEFGRECFCDNIIRNGATQQPIHDCIMTCPGDDVEQCGGPGRLNLFISGVSPVLPLELVGNGYNGAWDYIGSFGAISAGDSLVNPIFDWDQGDWGSVRNCVDWCWNEWSSLFCGILAGLCFSGDGLVPGAVPLDASNNLCQNEPGVICGGDEIMQVYHYKA